jgi:hypothetical protein
MAQLAVCPGCGAPLIPTMTFPGAEFYCLECGRKLGMFSPDGVDETPERMARYEALKAEWDEHAEGKLLIPRSWKDGCPNCQLGNVQRFHVDHATDAERAAHEAAMEWLRERAAA